MSPTVNATPFYKKLAFNLLSLSLMGMILYVGKSILIPLFFSMLLASLLLPLVMFLENKNVNRIVAILLSLLLSTATIVGVIYFLSSQLAGFFEDIDVIKERLQ